MRAPMMSIHTVAAGGGSILAFDGARLRVGPESAGANPGPASYRRGGPLATTDANVLLGQDPAGALSAGLRPRRRRSRSTATPRRAQVRAIGRAHAQAAAGRDRDAPSRWPAVRCRSRWPDMANAIKRISVARGYDVTRYTLQCFGGAGGQHACGVADALGMTRVFVHPLAGVLSAYGMGLADQIAMREASVELPLDAAGLAAAQRRGWRQLATARRRRVGEPGRRRAHDVRIAAPRARALPGHRHRAGACPWPTLDGDPRGLREPATASASPS